MEEATVKAAHQQSGERDAAFETFLETESRGSDGYGSHIRIVVEEGTRIYTLAMS